MVPGMRLYATSTDRYYEIVDIKVVSGETRVYYQCIDRVSGMKTGTIHSSDIYQLTNQSHIRIV